MSLDANDQNSRCSGRTAWPNYLLEPSGPGSISSDDQRHLQSACQQCGSTSKGVARFRRQNHHLGQISPAPFATRTFFAAVPSILQVCPLPSLLASQCLEDRSILPSSPSFGQREHESRLSTAGHGSAGSSHCLYRAHPRHRSLHRPLPFPRAFECPERLVCTVSHRPRGMQDAAETNAGIA